MALDYSNNTWVAEGDLRLPDIHRLEVWLRQEPSREMILDLGSADVPDGSTMAALTSLVRRQLVHRPIVLREPPQLVVHNLYRVGCHPHPQLRVVDMRSDEAYG
jgi:hypothetical protein